MNANSLLLLLLSSVCLLGCSHSHATPPVAKDTLIICIVIALADGFILGFVFGRANRQ